MDSLRHGIRNDPGLPLRAGMPTDDPARAGVLNESHMDGARFRHTRQREGRI